MLRAFIKFVFTALAVFVGGCGVLLITEGLNRHGTSAGNAFVFVLGLILFFVSICGLLFGGLLKFVKTFAQRQYY